MQGARRLDLDQMTSTMRGRYQNAQRTDLARMGPNFTDKGRKIGLGPQECLCTHCRADLTIDNSQ